jgi:hypothetical protein
VLFAVLERWIAADYTTDDELCGVLTADAYALYDNKLGVRQRHELHKRTAALKAAFKLMYDSDAILKDFTTDEQKAELERKYADLIKQSWKD